VLTLTATGIARIVAFADPGRFTSFGLPPEDPAYLGDELVVFLGRRPFRGDSEGSAWSA
jgi:hypothetical protein